MNNRMNRSKSRPITGNVSIISKNGTSNQKNITGRRNVSTGRNISTYESKERREKKFRHKNGNEMLSPKTIEYSKSKFFIKINISRRKIWRNTKQS